MTIKETETLTGMPRASIRFYEAENLIAPEREKNGYRVYTQKDIDILLRIKLLRGLDIPLADIRTSAAGQTGLPDCLARRMEQIDQDNIHAARSREICRQLLEDAVDFSSLDPQKYLPLLEAELPVSAPAPTTGPEKTFQRPGPWRRFLARSFDHSLYILIWEFFLAAAFRVNLTAHRSGWDALCMTLLESAALMALVMLVEPLLLSRWGTTPGKWILGIYVTGDNGKNLPYRAALSRCWELLLYGFGLFIPIYTVARQCNSLLQIRRGEELDWELDSQLQLRSKSRLRPVAYIMLTLLLIAAQPFIRTIPETPPNRGELTIAEFSVNFNALWKYYGDHSGMITTKTAAETALAIPWLLDASGSWSPRNDDDFYAYVHSVQPPELQFVVDEEGILQQVSFSGLNHWWSGDAYESDDIQGRSFDRHIFLMKIAALAYIGAQSESCLLAGESQAIAELVTNWREDFTFTLHGVTVLYDVEFSDCTPDSGGWPHLVELENTDEHSISYTFSMTTAKKES